MYGCLDVYFRIFTRGGLEVKGRDGEDDGFGLYGMYCN